MSISIEVMMHPRAIAPLALGLVRCKPSFETCLLLFRHTSS